MQCTQKAHVLLIGTALDWLLNYQAWWCFPSACLWAVKPYIWYTIRGWIQTEAPIQDITVFPSFISTVPAHSTQGMEHELYLCSPYAEGCLAVREFSFGCLACNNACQKGKAGCFLSYLLLCSVQETFTKFFSVDSICFIQVPMLMQTTGGGYITECCSIQRRKRRLGTYLCISALFLNGDYIYVSSTLAQSQVV